MTIPDHFGSDSSHYQPHVKDINHVKEWVDQRGLLEVLSNVSSLC